MDGAINQGKLCALETEIFDVSSAQSVLFPLIKGEELALNHQRLGASNLAHELGAQSVKDVNTLVTTTSGRAMKTRIILTARFWS
eukprot:scaffold120471_cov13-Tisochrysis_lutea.AAC.1